MIPTDPVVSHNLAVDNEFCGVWKLESHMYQDISFLRLCLSLHWWGVPILAKGGAKEICSSVMDSIKSHLLELLELDFMNGRGKGIRKVWASPEVLFDRLLWG